MQAPLGLILAGGMARRMGGAPKHGLMLGAQSLLDHAIARLHPQVSDLAINANIPVQSDFAVLGDTMDGHLGPLAGILAGLDWAQTKGAQHIVSVAVDSPFFPCDLVARLVLAGLTHPQGLASAQTTDGVHGTFGIWPVTLHDPLRDFLTQGGRKLRAFTDLHGAAMARFGDDAAFFNINTPEDLQQAIAWL